MSVHAGSAAVHHGAPTGFIRKYIFSWDHKVIGIQYYFLALVAVMTGMTLSVFMRLRLAWPGLSLPFVAGGKMTPEQYLALVTMHGTIMVFFVLTTAPMGAFGNFALPIEIGAADMAFPMLNMLSFWVTFVAFAVMLSAFLVPGGAPIAGWTPYPPLAGLGAITGPGEGMGQTLWIVSIALFCVAAMLGSLNFIATTLDLRCKGMSLMRMPLTVWSWFITAIISLLAFAVLLAAGVLLLMDRLAGTSFFIPAGLVINEQIVNHKGGSPILYQHLFWFFGHPEVYIAILPGAGAAGQILSTFARKPIFGYRVMVYCMVFIAFLSFCVWGHHMFITGMSPYSAVGFSIITLTISVPFAIMTINWLATLWKGAIRFKTPMLFAIGFVSLIVSGGLGGIFLGQPSLDLYLHDTYFVVGHFHLVMGTAAIFGIFAATYFWFPKMFGRMMNEGLGKIHFWFSFVGTYAIFMTMHYLGLAGHPRRYADTSGVDYLAHLQPVHVFISIAAFVTISAQLIFFFNLFWSMFRGPKAPENPWEATTLEWTVPSPPPHDNFGGNYPVVYRGAFEYSKPGAAQDYILQTTPDAAVK